VLLATHDDVSSHPSSFGLLLLLPLSHAPRTTTASTQAAAIPLMLCRTLRETQEVPGLPRSLRLLVLALSTFSQVARELSPEPGEPRQRHDEWSGLVGQLPPIGVHAVVLGALPELAAGLGLGQVLGLSRFLTCHGPRLRP